MKKRKNNNAIIINVTIVLILAWFTFQLIDLSRKNQERKSDLAEINHIRYGLLNIDEWEGKIAIIISKKINEFELDSQNRAKFKADINKILHSLIDDFEELLRIRTSGKFSKFKKWVAGFAVDIEELRRNVPNFSETILNELSNKETKADLKNFILIKLDEFLDATFNKDAMIRLQELLDKYEYKNKEDCSNNLRLLINQEQIKIDLYAWIMIVFVVVVFFFNILKGGKLSNNQMFVMVFSLACLLVVGVSTPMIELEARIDMLLFKLIGEDVVFKDQIFFFQSKSIINVVQVLMSDKSIKMIAVGGLIFIFSVVFPTLKLVSAWIYHTNFSNLKNAGIIKFFVFKSGKWSMADVMVVALFMAYIGFNGVVSSQLKNLSDAAKPIQIFSTNGTQLICGFFVFLTFCILSLVLSEIVTRKTQKKRSTPAKR